MIIYKRDNSFNAVSSVKIVNNCVFINHGLTKKWKELKDCVVLVTASLVVIKDEFGDDLTFYA